MQPPSHTLQQLSTGLSMTAAAIGGKSIRPIGKLLWRNRIPSFHLPIAEIHLGKLMIRFI
jgi:hypothetical protein